MIPPYLITCEVFHDSSLPHHLRGLPMTLSYLIICEVFL